jgi:hypothetical protein
MPPWYVTRICTDTVENKAWKIFAWGVGGVVSGVVSDGVME